VGFSNTKSAESCQAVCGGVRLSSKLATCTYAIKSKAYARTSLTSLWLTTLGVAVGLACSSQVLALGLGGVKSKSYIGQPLWVEIPLYNVEAPNALKIDLEQLNDGVADDLRAELSRANSQLSVLIRSESVVNEPYFNFSLNLNDQGNEFRKQFTVLLNLSPGDVRLASRPASERASLSTNAQTKKVESALTADSLIPSVKGRDSVMGPYDWAKAGAVPDTFGAVLDGQSLWRVARRISPALNATNNQMMWALFKANPDAFSNGTIESLRAGSFLNIPSASNVVSVSDFEAKSLLDSLSADGPANAVRVAQPIRTDASDSIQEVDLAHSKGAGLDSADKGTEDSNWQFQLSGLESRVDSRGALVRAEDATSKEIIESLATTISSMTDQLERKNQQIEALKSQVSELKGFIESEASVVSRNSDSINNIAGATEPMLEASAPNIRYSWWLAILAALLVFGVSMRTRLASLWKSLNLTGARDQVEFQPTVMSQSIAQIEAEVEQTMSALNDDYGLEPDFNIGDSITVSELSMTFSESMSELLSDVTILENELGFEPRFARLIASGDLQLARQLLDGARGHDVDDERYHFHRLQLFALRYDEDSFYDYYSSIETDISHFTNVVQTDISKLVVQLAQH